ncbi:hypothetical protein E5082_22005 [Streptomyces griseoluteus]|uniref:Uncharacterized protein n=1 Tax=Streptomyces griseoluteus TaxID=29306 RepID=A0A4Z1DCU2_STRGP|nr:hypothetical protein [Streptomyces griseoluteus]TGN80086.1 hypothetical protein E5082_22005 [Streptomyces griseoluteus]GHE94344.1 hypothetical protein GCM10017776_08190 [Streptomyces griseoluteus]
MDARRYRMVVTSRTDYVRTGALVDEQLRHWLAQPPKRYNVDAFAEGRNEIAGGVTLDHDSVTGVTGAYGRWRLRETAPGGTWQTTLVTRQITDGPTWVQLDVEHLPDDAEAAPVPAKTPRLAKHLLEALDAHDGLADVTAMPQVVEAEDVEAVIDELCDADRRLPVVMASTPYDADFDAWLEGTVDPLVRPLAGLAILYVLTPKAESVFNRALEHHRVYNGGIRTYLPGVDPAWPADGQRHRVMSKRLITENPRLAARILNQLPQGLATRLPLPDALDSVPLMRTRARDGVGGSEQERLRDENDALHEILEEAAREQRVRADEIRDLKRELRRAENNEAQVVVDYDEQYKELHQAKAQIRELQRELLRLGAAEQAYATVEPSLDAPTSFAEILDRIDDMRRVHFSGRRKYTLELDDQAYGSSWVRMAWDALLALQDFAEAVASGEANCDFKQWCADAPEGAHVISPRKVVRDESKSVKANGEWSRARTFPVPRHVHSDGKLFMGAHLRIGGGNTIAPRLHYYDGACTDHGIYVGYMGPHLTNTMT